MESRRIQGNRTKNLVKQRLTGSQGTSSKCVEKTREFLQPTDSREPSEVHQDSQGTEDKFTRIPINFIIVSFKLIH